MMNQETVLLIAAMLAAAVGAPLVQGIKGLVLMVTGRALEGGPALWLALGTAMALGLAAVAAAGYFAPPYPGDWQGWVRLIGGSIGAIFAAMTVVYKQLMARGGAE